MYYLPYNKNLKELSRYLRNNSTWGEVLLWKELRAGSLKGYRFNRQKPIHNYVVDFYCKKMNLVIEVDGSVHDRMTAGIHDQERQKILERMGLSFLRFNNQDVLQNISWFVAEIEDFIDGFEVSGKVGS